MNAAKLHILVIFAPFDFFKQMTEQEIHIDKIRKEMQASGADAFLVTSNVNLYYTTGQVVTGYLYIPIEGAPVLFVRRPAGLEGEHTVYVRKPEQITEIMAERGMPLPQRIMLEGDSLSHTEGLRYGAIFQPASAINGTPAIQKARSVKTEAELELIRRSGRLHAAVYRKIPGLYRAGMTDLDISIEIEHEMRRAGNLGIFRVFGQSMEIFMGSVLAGDNACEASPYDFALGGKGMHPSIPVGADNSKLRRGMSLMVDMGGNFTGYMTDMTRTYSVGKLTEKAYRAHQTALEIQDAIANMMRPGTVCEEIYNKSVEMAGQNGLADCYMGVRQQARFVGHGVGIEVNELPVLGVRSRTELEPGMVLAVEPKFVIEEAGAVGIENTFAVTTNGNEKLTILDEEIVNLEAWS
jgi:Xaa-Pro aminopeptidase